MSEWTLLKKPLSGRNGGGAFVVARTNGIYLSAEAAAGLGSHVLVFVSGARFRIVAARAGEPEVRAMAGRGGKSRHFACSELRALLPSGRVTVKVGEGYIEGPLEAK